MDTKFKILPVICCLALLAGCEKLFYRIRPSFGKKIFVSIRYPKPFKLGDTIWIKYGVGQNDMLRSSSERVESIPLAEFTDQNQIVIIGNGKLPDPGEYVNVTGDYAATKRMHYNSDTRRYEANFGFVPNKKGICEIILADINLKRYVKNVVKKWWILMPYIEDFSTEDTVHNKRHLEIMVE